MTIGLKISLLLTVAVCFGGDSAPLIALESDTTRFIQEETWKCSETKNSLPFNESAPISTCTNGVMDVPYSSRSYFYDDQTLESDRCDPADRSGQQPCASYTKGAFFLSGKVLEYDVDLSRTQCGCNAAIYLVDMATNDQLSTCGDHYCDANGICGTYCTEIDLMEANSVAWKTVIHHKFDRSGDGFGWGRWLVNEKGFVLLQGNGQVYFECLYGPSAECAIDTTQVFHASFVFSDASVSTGEFFSFQTILSQDGRSIIATPIRYSMPTPFVDDQQLSESLSNMKLAESIDEGFTLVASYWGGPNVDSMSWLDMPCDEEGCRDVFTDRSWSWICSGSGETNCDQSYRVSNIKVSSVLDFDYNAAATAGGITSFFVSDFDP